MPVPSPSVRCSRLAHLALLVAACVAILPAADFNPPRPYVYVTPADVARMRDNVARYAWAQSLFNEAKSVSDANATGKLILGKGNTVGLKTARYLMAHGLCHLITGEQKYADRAISWIRIYAQNNIHYDSFSDDVAGAADRLGSWYAIFPVVYDMVHDRMAAADRTLISAWLANRWYSPRILDGFKSNHSFGQAASVLVTAFALGDQAKMDACTQAFRAHQSGWAGSYFWDPSTQAWKNWYFTCDSAMLVGIVSHNAKRAGYAGIDLLLDPIADGWNLKDGNFKTVYDFSTPLGQVPYQSMWKGGMFLNQTGTYATQALDVLAQRENWPDKETYAWFVHKNPSKKMYGNDWEMFDLWPGLTWGRHIATTPQPRNDSVNHPGRGFAVLKSGNPAGPMTDTTLHAYLMHGLYGTVEGMNLKLYGKGRKLTQERFTSNSWGDYGSGGIYLTEPKPPTPVDIYAIGKSYQAGATQHLWSVDSAHLKIMAFDFRGGGNVTPGSHVRTVATTNEYFWDLYRQHSSGSRTCTYVCDGVGNTATASVATGRAFTGNFWVDWAKHMRYWGVAENTSSIALTPYADLAVKEHFDSAAGTADQYPSEIINKLQVRRTNVSGPQDFIGVYEPLGGGTTRLTAVTRFNTTGTTEATAIRVVGLDYTDILAYQHTVADRVLVSGSESLRCHGRYGYVRYHKGTRTLIVQGDVSAFAVTAPLATSLVVNGTPRAFTQNGDLVSWSANGSPPADTVAPTAPGNLVATVGGTNTISLAWTASTDNVGVTGYVVSRDGTAIATIPDTTYAVTGLSAATAYAFTVRARDATGNLSTPATVTATTQAPAVDSTPPTTPGNLVATATGSTAIALTWTAANDNVGVTGYVVSRSGAADVTVTGTSYIANGLTPSTAYTFTVRAGDAAGNRSTAATASATTTAQPTTHNPFTRIQAEAYNAMKSVVIANADVGQKIGSIHHTDWVRFDHLDFAGGAASFRARVSSAIANGGTIELRLGSSTGTLIGTCTVPNTGGWTTYVERTCAVSGVSGAQHLYLVFTGTGSGALLDVDWFEFTALGAPDTIAPSMPSGLTAIANGPNTIALAWTAATDDVGVTGYVVSRSGATDVTVTGTTATLAGLNPATTYTVTVRARDAAGNLSAAATASATTTGQSTTQNAFLRIEAESYAARNGLDIYDGGSGRKIGSIEHNTWASYALDFAAGATGCLFRVASNTSGGTIEVRLGSTSGTLLGSCAVPGTGGWNQFIDLTCPISGVSGVQEVFLVFKGGSGSLLDVDWFQFSAPLPLDTQAPTPPTQVQAAATSSDTAALTWTASTDNLLVTGYEVWRNGAVVGTVATATFTDTGLAPNTAYSYTVRARDAAGNWSAASAATTLTTPALPVVGTAFTTIQAEDFDAMQGVSISDADVGRKVGSIHANDWIRFDQLDFGPGATTVSVRVSSPTSGGNIQFRLGGPTGSLIATVWVPVTGGWNTFTIRSADLARSVTGTQDLCLVFIGSGNGSLFDVDWFRFTATGATVAAALPQTPGGLTATATEDGATRISGRAAPGVIITVLFDGVAQGTAVAGEDGAWAWLTQALTGEAHVVTAVATDASGGTSATSDPIIVPSSTANNVTAQESSAGGCGSGFGIAFLLALLACLPLCRYDARCGAARDI